VTEIPLPEEPMSPQPDEKLRELTSQSWNLELVISGAAMFAILQLPDLLDVVFDYFRFNLLSHATGMLALLPSLVYSMMKASCYVLFAAFLTNFVMRAFWVGLVGLLSVYPTGIHYNRIPFVSRYAQEQMSDELGSLQNYIIRLDRRCNIVFAVSFLFVFFLITVAMVYTVSIIGYSFIRPLIADEYMSMVKVLALLPVIGYFVAAIILSLPAVRANPRGARLQYKFSTLLQRLYWGLSRPSSFILNTFYSHIPAKKMLRMTGLMALLFIVTMTVSFLTDLSRQNERIYTVINGRHLFSSSVDSLFVTADTYDNLRSEGKYIETAAIQSDVIREPFVRLYVAYPKSLDMLLTAISKEPVWDDNKSTTEKRRNYATWSNAQINSLVQVSVNDSIYTNPGLLFTIREKPRQQGWQTLLLPKNLKSGRNTLRITIQPPKEGELVEIANIPFWYVAE
jgi:hypothetical protein